MEKSGTITKEQAEDKMAAAALIEENFSNDPAHDAFVFSRAGIADKKEMVDILDKNNSPEKETKETP